MTMSSSKPGSQDESRNMAAIVMRSLVAEEKVVCITVIVFLQRYAIRLVFFVF